MVGFLKASHNQGSTKLDNCIKAYPYICVCILHKQWCRICPLPIIDFYTLACKTTTKVSDQKVCYDKFTWFLNHDQSTLFYSFTVKVVTGITYSNNCIPNSTCVLTFMYISPVCRPTQGVHQQLLHLILPFNLCLFVIN